MNPPADADNDLPLALGAEFPPAGREQWRKLVEAMLKGADFDKRLVGRTYDGLRIEPLYERRKDAHPVAARRSAAPWQVLQRADHPDPKTANAQALHDLENGAAGLSLVFAGSLGAHGYGLEGNADALARALEGVYLDAGVAVELDLSRQHVGAAVALADLVRIRGVAPAAAQIRFGFDPLGAMTMSGSALRPWVELEAIFSRRVSDLVTRGFHGPFAAADARVIHNAGGSEAQELGYALAAATAYLRALELHGIALDDARRMIFFRLSADADQFMTMAKFRALRKLWARVEEACGLKPLTAFVSAETAWRMMTKRDPYVNMLRITVAAFAAGLGGADAITVLPFTNALGLPDAFARRIARNTQLILLEESSLTKVADPAAGAGGIEDLTDKLCALSWAIFQEIEAAGGAAAAIEAGLIQNKVAHTRAERERAIATRKDPLTGTSEFPHLSENAFTVLDVAPAASLAPPRGERENKEFPALPPMRLAEPFEKLRDAADRATKNGNRPKVFLANLGTPADFTARAAFAKNFFEAGGIEAVEGSSNIADLATTFRQSSAKLVCLCSSDEVYARDAAKAAKALSQTGAMHIYLTGLPGETAKALQKAGVKTFIFAGCDAVATLAAAHDILGMKA